MDAFRKQAKIIRESVAKQQQAVFKTFATSAAPAHSETVVTDEAELQRHQQLERLYTATKLGKHFQRDIVKGVEGLTLAGSKLSEHSQALADACRRYATDGPGAGGALAKASLHCSNARFATEKERDTMHRNLVTQVGDPLKAMVNGAPLDDARMLTQRYDKLRQEAELQTSGITKMQQKVREGSATPEQQQRLQQAEQKMEDLSSAMVVLGKEAAAAMIAVEAQQQRLTLQRLIAMVEAERAFHRRAAEILDQLHTQVVAERQRSESMPPSSQGAGDRGSTNPFADPDLPSYEEVVSNDSQPAANAKKGQYYLAEVMHSFQAENAGELNISAGDFLVVRQVSPTGWAEGESKGRAGWFPAAYVEKRQRVPASKLVEAAV
eukprot:TRINITY_DN20520_c0_g1_i1.p1 TRINITY_DN20520_c0_g1~~TRINITY_DN20520_c0_g1_i1.p1  ORF type:complete len:380 (+),score=82.17 TRINITY_DN20520_c0_g1_i1:193-1332(+)